ncbi:MAG: hypothetical protein ACLPJH_00190 [Myxococcaceae bacterium]
MGFEIRVNGRKSVRAVLPGEGVLVFNVVVERAIGTEPSDNTVTIYSGDLYELDTTGSRFMRWANIKAAIGDRIAVRFVSGGTSSPKPRVRSVDNVVTRFGLTERLRILKKELSEIQRKLTLSEPELRRQGLRKWRRMQAKTRRNLAGVEGKRLGRPTK